MLDEPRELLARALLPLVPPEPPPKPPPRVLAPELGDTLRLPTRSPPHRLGLLPSCSRRPSRGCQHQAAARRPAAPRPPALDSGVRLPGGCSWNLLAPYRRTCLQWPCSSRGSRRGAANCVASWCFRFYCRSRSEERRVGEGCV